jgi:CheY-like chemotaxis protein
MKPLNILIVDDSATMRQFVRRAVQLSEVPVGEVHEAANGKEALAVIDAHDVDALFTDIASWSGRDARRRSASWCQPMDPTPVAGRCRVWRDGM